MHNYKGPLSHRCEYYIAYVHVRMHIYIITEYLYVNRYFKQSLYFSIFNWIPSSPLPRVQPNFHSPNISIYLLLITFIYVHMYVHMAFIFPGLHLPHRQRNEHMQIMCCLRSFGNIRMHISLLIYIRVCMYIHMYLDTDN